MSLSHGVDADVRAAFHAADGIIAAGRRFRAMPSASQSQDMMVITQNNTTNGRILRLPRRRQQLDKSHEISAVGALACLDDARKSTTRYAEA